MSKFVSTEGNCGPPIVLHRQPVLIPSGIIRGEINTVLMPCDSFDEERRLATIVTRSACGRFRFAYHSVEVLAYAPDFREIKAIITPETIVTWDEVQ